MGPRPGNLVFQPTEPEVTNYSKSGSTPTIPNPAGAKASAGNRLDR